MTNPPQQGESEPISELDTIIDDIWDIGPFTDAVVKSKAKARIEALIKTRETEAREDIVHRIGDILAWHISQGNIEMVHRSLTQIMTTFSDFEKTDRLAELNSNTNKENSDV